MLLRPADIFTPLRLVTPLIRCAITHAMTLRFSFFLYMPCFSYTQISPGCSTLISIYARCHAAYHCCQSAYHCYAAALFLRARRRDICRRCLCRAQFTLVRHTGTVTRCYAFSLMPSHHQWRSRLPPLAMPCRRFMPPRYADAACLLLALDASYGRYAYAYASNVSFAISRHCITFRHSRYTRYAAR